MDSSFPDKKPTLKPHPLLPEYHQSEDQRRAALNTYFDQVAPDYDWISQMLSFGSGNWYRARALRLAGLDKGQKVLDIACGPGTLSLCAKDLVGESGLVLGLDPSMGMLRHARKNGISKILRGRAEQLPFVDGSFDFLIMGYALRHASDLNQTFKEFHRVLKSSGRILILEIARPDSFIPYHFSRIYLKCVVPGLSFLRTRNPYTRTLMRYFWDTIQFCISPASIILALQNSGFKNCQEHSLMGVLIRDDTGQKP